MRGTNTAATLYDEKAEQQAFFYKTAADALINKGMQGVTAPLPYSKVIKDKRKTDKDILLVLDLDYTHFNSSIRDRVVWLGGKESWVKFYEQLSAVVENRGGRLIITIVSNKDSMDDLVQAMLNTLHPLLEKHNPSMFALPDSLHSHFLDGKACLVYNNGCFYWLSLTKNKDEKTNASREVFSSCILVQGQPKSAAILSLCYKFGISPEQAILLDDTPEVLDEVVKRKINAVSCECFHIPPGGETEKLEKLKDAKYVDGNINEIRAKLMKKVIGLIDAQEKAELAAAAKNAANNFNGPGFSVNFNYF